MEKYIFSYKGTISSETIDGKMKELAEKVGYRYRNISWLKRAFYSEIAFETNEEKYANSPMGTLGDSIIKLILSEFYFDKGMSSAEITDEKSKLEENPKFKKISDKMYLYIYAFNDKFFFKKAPEHEKLPNSEHNRYFEALVAAIYKDRGMREARKFVLRILELNDEKNT